MCYYKKPMQLKKVKNPSSIKVIEDYRTGKTGEKPVFFTKCGKCFACRCEKARAWTFKIFLEAKETEEKCFLTLTLRNNEQKSLDKEQPKNFIKRLRKSILPNGVKIKNLTCGEYGEKKKRPHYHIVMLGWQPKDLVWGGKTAKGNDWYFSKTIKKTWGLGRITVQHFHYKEVGYISLYLNKNLTIVNEFYSNYMAEKRLISERKKLKRTMLKDTGLETLEELRKYLPKLYKEYKKKYRIEKERYNNHIEMEKEYTTSSKNIGFEIFCKRDPAVGLIIENRKFEIPKEFLDRRLKIETNQKYLETLKQIKAERDEMANEQIEELTKGNLEYEKEQIRIAKRQEMDDLNRYRKAIKDFDEVSSI